MYIHRDETWRQAHGKTQRSPPRSVAATLASTGNLVRVHARPITIASIVAAVAVVVDGPVVVVDRPIVGVVVVGVVAAQLSLAPL